MTKFLSKINLKLVFEEKSEFIIFFFFSSLFPPTLTDIVIDAPLLGRGAICVRLLSG